MVTHKSIFNIGLSVILLLSLLFSPLMPDIATADTATFTITAEVAAGQGWIDTVEPVNPIPLGAAKHYRVHPARGWMISDVQIDGRSIGPSMVATIPFVQANHTIRAFFEPFDAVKATNISTKLSGPVRVLLIGEPIAVQRIAQYLGQLDDQNLIWVGFQGILKGNDLLLEYYSNRSGPSSRNTMLRTITEGWDYVIPIDLFDYQSLSPELHLEGVRLIGNRAWFEGGQARLILPTLWTDNNSAQDQDKITANVYRMASSMRVPVAPVGQAWAKVVADLGVADSPVEEMNNNAAYVFAAMLYAQFYEQQPTALVSTIEPSLRNPINEIVWSTWQAEKTKVQFSGAFSGLATPFLTAGGQGYHFGTSTRWLSVDKMKSLIGDRDPEMGFLETDGADGMDQATVPGDVQNNLNSKNYTYMWRQWKGEDTVAILNGTIRGQFDEDPYFIWYERYMDQTADVNAGRVGYGAFLEARNALFDNMDTLNNPNRKGRAPQSHIGWGRVWEERTDIQMMENLSETPAHAHDVMMSMFAAQTYALITGRDASHYGSWQYDPNSEPDLAEKARYAQRVGYETIMQHGYLNINEPYDQSPSDLPVFNQHSIFYTPPKTFHAQDDLYVVWTGETLTVPASSILANDPNVGGAPLTINWQPRQATSGEFVLNEDGSFSYTPGGLDKGAIWLRYTLSDGATESNSAIIWIQILDSSVYTEKVHLPMLAR